MSSRADIDAFLSHSTVALVGLSRTGKKFSNLAYRELIAKGRRVFPIHPAGVEIEGARTYKSFAELPEPVSAALFTTPPRETARMVGQALDAGVTAIWIQQGAESDEAIRIGRERGAKVVSGRCFMMFLEPAAFVHRVHRGVLRLFGRLPA